MSSSSSCPQMRSWVHADAGTSRTSLSNMLLNAAKYTPNGGKIAVTLDLEDTEAHIRIRDTGVSASTPRCCCASSTGTCSVDADAPRSEGAAGCGLALGASRREARWHRQARAMASDAAASSPLSYPCCGQRPDRVVDRPLGDDRRAARPRLFTLAHRHSSLIGAHSGLVDALAFPHQ